MIITGQKPNSWKDLQLKVGEILTRCGFDVEIEKKMVSVRGSVEIDVYAVETIDTRKYSLLCECKYWGSSIPQTIIHGFRTVVSDIGCNIGYVITTSQYQSGAKETAEKTNVELVTWEDFQNIFFESWYSNYFYNEINKELTIDWDYDWVEWFDDLNKSDRHLYNETKNKLSELSEIKGYFPMPFLKNINKSMFLIPKLPLENNLFNMSEYYGDLPLDILQEENYQEFLVKIVSYGRQVIEEYDQLDKKYKKE